MLNPPDGNAIKKIDEQATAGLSGIPNSLAYRVEEIEKHFHSSERWFGSDGDGTGSTTNNITSFRLTAGAIGVYGSGVQVLGANDITSGDYPGVPSHFDMHRVLVTDASAANNLYMVQIWAGVGTFGAANLISEFPFYINTSQTRSAPILVQMGRQTVDKKIWMRLKSSAATATCDLILGIHSYSG